MSFSQSFTLVNLLAAITWLFILVFPKWKHTRRVVFGFSVLLLCIIYAAMVTLTFQADDFAQFSTLTGLMSLFQSEQAVLVGWIHYLAFDLMVGLYILDNGQKHQIKHGYLVPCFLFTFFFGPTGLLLYRILRSFHGKHPLDYD